MKILHHSSTIQGIGHASDAYMPPTLYFISLGTDGVFLSTSMDIDATVNNFVSVQSEDVDGNQGDFFDLTF